MIVSEYGRRSGKRRDRPVLRNVCTKLSEIVDDLPQEVAFWKEQSIYFTQMAEEQAEALTTQYEEPTEWPGCGGRIGGCGRLTYNRVKATIMHCIMLSVPARFVEYPLIVPTLFAVYLGRVWRNF